MVVSLICLIAGLLVGAWFGYLLGHRQGEKSVVKRTSSEENKSLKDKH